MKFTQEEQLGDIKAVIHQGIEVSRLNILASVTCSTIAAISYLRDI